MTRITDKTILIVDDDEAIARIVKLILQKYGFNNLIIVHSGLQALDVLGLKDASPNAFVSNQSISVDIVLLDVFLPDINGFEVCDRIKKSFGQSLPVIIITGFCISEYIARGVAAGADDFLSKPIIPDELFGRINNLLQRSGEGRFVESCSKKIVTDDQENEKCKLNQALPSEGKKIDHYRVKNILSWSASTVIYTVIDINTGTQYVLKQLLKQVLEFEDVVHRFYREIKMMKGIKHPNICGVYDYGEVDGCPYCVIEFMFGKNLQLMLKELGTLELPIVKKVANGIARALSHVHKSGIIHRDVKLNNIYLCRDESVKLSDFGVAIKIGETRLTLHGYVIGTPIYMSPEQFDGAKVTQLSDIYSYGASLYHLITGRPPFTAENVEQLMYKHQNETPVPIKQFRENIPAGWNQLIVSQCLAKKPEDRPQSLIEVIDTLRDLKI